jgi:hypothetical protein
MVDTPPTLGKFIADMMRKQQHNNMSLAVVAHVSEGVIRNLLKYGIDPNAKDPDPRTLRSVADALGIDATMLFRLAGYIPPKAYTNSVRAEYLADVFDELASEKQDAVLGVLEAMSESYTRKKTIQLMRKEVANPLAGFDLQSPRLVKVMANELIARYQMTEPVDVDRIEQDVQVVHHQWKALPQSTQERIKALIQHKLSLDYDPTMVDPEWRN